MLPFYVHRVLMKVLGPPKRKNKDLRKDWMTKIGMDAVDTMDQNIRLFLKDKTSKMDFPIERAEELFPVFWERIGAEGDLGSALEIFRSGAKGQQH